MSGIHGAPITRRPPSPRYPDVNPPRPEYERAARAVDVAFGRLPFRVHRVIIHPSPRGLSYGLIVPVAP